MNWLEKIQAPRFYRYMFYKSYQVGIKLGTDDPPLAAEYNMIITTACQLFFLIGFISHFTGISFASNFFSLSFIPKLILIVSIVGINYFLFVYKKKWQRISKEFQGENNKQRKKGFTYLFVYTFISLALIFGPALWIIIYGPWWK